MDSTTVDEIEIAVSNAIQDGVDAARGKGLERPPWTAAIMAELLMVGERLKYEVCVRPCCDRVTFPEWLWDMVWLQLGGGNRSNLLGLPLAVESEWSMSEYDLLYDFRKLLVSRADLRVMIFQTPTLYAHYWLELLRKEINQYSGTQKGDRYLLAYWCFGGPAEGLQFTKYVAD